ncbi:peroxiredoxin [Listeria fleischmannii subsp. coloradonensis]|jgi:peroxiredoxin (alkyl hydroperoxide reductase subunit C)|uniref:Peroxiredoxin n=1 Tax=Listeria fleischmannii TaxID=1069827 RepID=A0A841YB47_9LIST|nr:peroxiredoxin [Listeria fleischmannii subsp. coloradonensis]MBC1397495.1 peroxiredoxin [Listeria fleischmannii]MBC1418367.1 peroxiredoxin [Listeria fleischmannii]MBC1425864.1 peroxiredoxin [Listeria fleischmannii]STY35117.1 Probable peroxiredoxin [Listeria fleischmannii subsp. coloradonensis]
MELTTRLVGNKAPSFCEQAVMPDATIQKVSLSDFITANKWLVLFFYPKDFTFICPAEIMALSARMEEFKHLDTDIVGISSDTVHTHLEWTQTPVAKGGIGKLNYPLLEDTSYTVAKNYGVFVEKDSETLRGLFIINPEGEVVYETIHLNIVSREVDEILRVLTALQTGGLCEIEW